jgi:purine-binding chemotaxis protein CheW
MSVLALNAKSRAGTATAAAARPREMLTFRLGKEEYGIDILRVQEIRGYEEPTRIANAPAHVKGVINLRGRIVPIVDLRLKFDIANPSYDAFTVVVILNVGDRVIGAVVDSVSDVIEIAADQVRPPPEMEAGVDASYITGIGTLGERMLILVDIEKLMLANQLASVLAAADASA